MTNDPTHHINPEDLGNIVEASKQVDTIMRYGLFQANVEPWMLACFGEEISNDKVERRQRFLEEALELVQAAGAPTREVLMLLSYVYSRPVGEIHQEVGGVMVTLAALCRPYGVNMHECGNVELERIWTLVEKIREKQRTKPRNSPLPRAANTPTLLDADEWCSKTWDAFQSYLDAVAQEDSSEASRLHHANKLLSKGRDEIKDLQLQVAVAGTETAAYYAGQDAALAGISQRWEEALTNPIPKAGKMNEPLEGLYRRTEKLRADLQKAIAFIEECKSVEGYMVNGNRLSNSAMTLLSQIGEAS